MSDERPKPKYGELAPEGWVWQPPKPPTDDADATAEGQAPGASPHAGPSGRFGEASAPGQAPRPVGRPAPTRQPASGALTPKPGPTPATLPDGSPKPVNVGDLVATVILLVIGFIATANSVSGLLSLSTIIQQVLDMQGVDVAYTATAAAGVLGSIGSVGLVLLYGAAVWLSVRAIRLRRLAFFIPLAIAVLSFMLLFFVLILAFFADGAVVHAMFDATPAP